MGKDGEMGMGLKDEAKAEVWVGERDTDVLWLPLPNRSRGWKGLEGADTSSGCLCQQEAARG